MASENKSSTRLAADVSDDPTSELEILSVDLIPTEEELEMDANTFALDANTAEGSNVAVLQSDLRSKDERISSLQFDIEQLRARWTGLEKEISAREELTEILQKDLRSAEKGLRSKDKSLSRNARKIDSLSGQLESALQESESAQAKIAELEGELAAGKEQLEQFSDQQQRLETDLDAARKALPAKDDEDNRLASQKIEIAELKAYIDGRYSAWDEQETELAAATDKLRSQSDDIDALRKQLSIAEADSKATRRENDSLKKALRESHAREDQLRADTREMDETIRHFENVERKASEVTIAELRGNLSEFRQRVTGLESQLIRAESYADDMRDRLTGTLEDTSRSSAENEDLASALQAAKAMVTDLENQLEFERDRSATLQSHNETYEADFAAERDTLQMQIAAAHSELAEQREINEQLASDLIDNKVYRQALEEQSQTASEAHEVELKKLRKKVTALKAQTAEDQEKISNKDNAISALLNELANKSKTLESIDEIENVIHEIDDRMSERIDDRAFADRDRPTRLLVGTIDGQELRFPLFKDRLTIGRTVQNDIQLRAQHISRRHAVIFADGEGTRIVDWGSKNGVYVNSERISEQALSSGDKVTIGTAEFVYEELSRRPAE